MKYYVSQSIAFLILAVFLSPSAQAEKSDEEHKKETGQTAKLAEIKTGYVDKRWDTQDDLTSTGDSYLAKMDSYFDVDMRVSYPVYHDDADREVRIKVAGENILDEKIVEEYGCPLPGTTVMAGLRADF